MTRLEVCSKCGGEFRAYENGDGTAYGRCYNCGTSHYFGPLSEQDRRDAELLANHLRGSRR